MVLQHGTSKHQLIQEERLHRASFVPVLVGLAGMLLHTGILLAGNERFGLVLFVPFLVGLAGMLLHTGILLPGNDRFGLVSSSLAWLSFGVSMPAATWGVVTFAWDQISMYIEKPA